MYLSQFKSLKKLKSILMTTCFLHVFILSIFVISVWSAAGDYNGTYSGTFSGDDNGYWFAVIEDATMKFYAWSTTNSSIDPDLDMSVDENGNFSGTSDHKGLNTSGTIVDGAVSGTYDDSGSLTGQIESEPSPFEGDYSGPFSGDSSGTAKMTIYADGHLDGVATWAGGSINSEGGVSSDGWLIILNDNGAGNYATISDSSYSGIWTNSFTGNSGTFNGSLIESDGGGGGGGGGGCFVEIITQ